MCLKAEGEPALAWFHEESMKGVIVFGVDDQNLLVCICLANLAELFLNIRAFCREIVLFVQTLESGVVRVENPITSGRFTAL